jgi:acetyltransferase-like isoleucine patch superfamily enzyme
MQPISAIVLERLLGIAALLIIGSLCAAALLARHALLHTALVGLLLAAGAGACIVFWAAWYSGPVRRRLSRLTHSPKLEPLSQNLRTLAVHPRQLTTTVALSFLFQILAVVVITVLFSAVGVDASFLQAGFIAVASGVAGVLPISINGIGVIEGSFTAAALETRIPFHEAVFVAMFLRLYMLVAGMLGGFLYALEPRPSRVPDTEEDLIMLHVPDKFSYLLRTLVHSPLDLVRLVEVALTTFKFRFIKRCIGPRSIVGEKTVFINSGNIKFGSGCLIQDRVYIRAGVDGVVEAGDGVAINSFVQIYGHGGVRIGEHTQIGPSTLLTTTGHDYRAQDLERNHSPIVIGKRVWIGAHVTILPGVSIGDHSVIGAGAVVTRDIPAYSLAVGVPARVVRSLRTDAIEKEAPTPTHLR